MPLINVKMARGRSLEQKRELVRLLTEDAVRILNVSPEWVTVIIDEYEREHWATAGELHADRYGSGYGRQGTENKGSG